MVVELTPDSIVTAGAVCTAVILLISKFAKGVRWFDQQGKQTSDIAKLKKRHEEDVASLHEELAEEIRRNNGELQLLTFGVLACLKGLQEQGCNGPVTKAIDKIETYLNQRAHDKE